MNIFLRKKFFRLLQICLLTLCGLSGGCDWDISSAKEEDDHKKEEEARSMEADEADAAAEADKAVMALLFPETPPLDTDLGMSNITTNDLANALKTNIMAAVITGNLSYGGGTGIYGFNVNLIDGKISNGTMRSNNNGLTFSVYSGTGQVSGNAFSVGNFKGLVANNTDTPGSGTSLTGTASASLGNLGDIGASGTFTVTSGTGNTSVVSDGIITDGQRVR